MSDVYWEIWKNWPIFWLIVHCCAGYFVLRLAEIARGIS
jgi:hypothetical protein